MLDFKWNMNSGLLGVCCVCDPQFNPDLHPSWHDPALENMLRYVIYSTNNMRRQLDIAGTFDPCESLSDAKGYLMCLDEMRGAWDRT